MINKIIFLDVDGVLNSARDGFSIDLETDIHLKLLKQLVKETNANIDYGFRVYKIEEKVNNNNKSH